MSANLGRIVSISIVAVLVVACNEDRRDPLSPAAPNKLVAVQPTYPIYQNPQDFLEITAGDFHTCARKRNGDVYCWGEEGGSVPTLTWQGATQISAGADHTCGLNSAGAAYCWGWGTDGQLGWGNGQFTGYSGPWPVAGPGWNGTPLTYTSIAAGGKSTCGTTSSGVFCWGILGNLTNPSLGGTAGPTLITNLNGQSYTGFTSLAVGGLHACGYMSWAKSANCWGADNLGQVGFDPATAIFIPGTSYVMFAMPNQLGSTVLRISLGDAFTCADMMAGTVACFGNNADGELGNGPGASTFVPQAVGLGMALHGVAAGVKHACALDPNANAWCWGADSTGQLGNNASATNFPNVQKVHALSIAFNVFGATLTFRAVAAGRRHSCGIGTDNHIYCWGDNTERQLGTNIYDANGNIVANGFSPNPVLTM
jgi:alpha-tubulin suppressor-like RCC1 family protein